LKRKIIWLAVSCAMVASLVLTSCAAEVTEEEAVTEKETVTEKMAETEKGAVTEEKVTEKEAVTEEKVAEAEVEMVKDSLGRMVEKPRYGGVFTKVHVDPSYFDEIYGHGHGTVTMTYTNGNLFKGDWLKGPTGKNEAGFRLMIIQDPPIQGGNIATSWEMPDDTTLIFHIRQGIHFQDKAPVYGRELDAEDVAFSLDRLWHQPNDLCTSVYCRNYPWEIHLQSITATDKWTVTMKFKPGASMEQIYEWCQGIAQIVPREIGDVGDGTLQDWRDAVGAGPFMLVDYVEESSMTFERNPNYWQNDPLHPDNQLPYLDGVKLLVMPDRSTQLAAMRTSKIDQLANIETEDADSLLAYNPNLKYAQFPSGGQNVMYIRVDNPAWPFYDLQVRRAMAMAVNNQEILDEYYGGNGLLFAWPIINMPEFSDMYTAPEDMPPETRSQFEYRPDDAIALLAEAGYPNGFSTEITCTVTYTDILSLIVAYWADVGIDAKIKVVESGAYETMVDTGVGYEIVMAGATSTAPFFGDHERADGNNNDSRVDDPYINAAYEEMGQYRWDVKRREIMTELSRYQLSLHFMLPFPVPNLWVFWQPWVKSYSGEIHAGYYGYPYDGSEYCWIDQDLKYELTGKR